MLGVLLIAVGLNVVHRRNFAEYVGRRAVLARRLVTSIHHQPGRRSVMSDMRRLRNTLTYLLNMMEWRESTVLTVTL